MTRRQHSTAPAHLLREIVSRSAPSPHRPRLPEEMEEKFREIDARSAECYADLESITHQLHETAQAVRDGRLDIQLSVTTGVVQEEIDSEHSLVVHVREAQEASQKRRADTDVFYVLEAPHK